VQAKLKIVVKDGYSEDRGDFSVVTLSIDVADQTVALFMDVHFYGTNIFDEKVEAAIVEAVGEQTEYAALCARRAEHRKVFENAVAAAQTYEQRERAYDLEEGYEQFKPWLESRGHSLVEEIVPPA
jgi:hypothetical protein